MIENEQQYQVTQAQLRRLLEALERTKPRPEGLHPKIHRAMQGSIEALIMDLRQELAAYEELKAQQVKPLELHALAVNVQVDTA